MVRKIAENILPEVHANRRPVQLSSGRAAAQTIGGTCTGKINYTPTSTRWYAGAHHDHLVVQLVFWSLSV